MPRNSYASSQPDFRGSSSAPKVSGSNARTRSAQVTLRIPAGRFDDARTEIPKIGSAIEQDSIEARDITREHVDQAARLRNYHAEEAQYLAILRRARAVKDVLEVSSKLAEVRGRIDELQADLRFLDQQVEMSLLTINMTAIDEAQVLGVDWRPLYQAKQSLHAALSAMAAYADSMLALLLFLPVVAVWTLTIIALVKVGWMVLRRTLLLLFPGLSTWFHHPVQSHAP